MCMLECGMDLGRRRCTLACSSACACPFPLRSGHASVLQPVHMCTVLGVHVFAAGYEVHACYRAGNIVGPELWQMHIATSVPRYTLYVMTTQWNMPSWTFARKVYICGLLNTYKFWSSAHMCYASPAPSDLKA